MVTKLIELFSETTFVKTRDTVIISRRLRNTRSSRRLATDGTTFSRRQRLPISGEGESLFRVASMLKFISQVNAGQISGWDHYERYAKRGDCGCGESCSGMG